MVKDKEWVILNQQNWWVKHNIGSKLLCLFIPKDNGGNYNFKSNTP